MNFFFEKLYERATSFRLSRDALYQAAKCSNLAAIRVRRPIGFFACRGFRWRACDYRPVVASLANLPIRLAEFHACPDLFQFRRLQEVLQDVANVPGRLAFQDG